MVSTCQPRVFQHAPVSFNTGLVPPQRTTRDRYVRGATARTRQRPPALSQIGKKPNLTWARAGGRDRSARMRARSDPTRPPGVTPPFKRLRRPVPPSAPVSTRRPRAKLGGPGEAHKDGLTFYDVDFLWGAILSVPPPSRPSLHLSALVLNAAPVLRATYPRVHGAARKTLPRGVSFPYSVLRTYRERSGARH